MTAARTARDVVEEGTSRAVRLGEHFDTRDALRNAKRQAEARDLARMLIVDADAHHYETESWADIIGYLEDPVLQHLARSSGVGRLSGAAPPCSRHRSATRTSRGGSRVTPIGIWRQRSPASSGTRRLSSERWR